MLRASRARVERVARCAGIRGSSEHGYKGLRLQQSGFFLMICTFLLRFCESCIISVYSVEERFRKNLTSPTGCQRTSTYRLTTHRNDTAERVRMAYVTMVFFVLGTGKTSTKATFLENTLLLPKEKKELTKNIIGSPHPHSSSGCDNGNY